MLERELRRLVIKYARSRGWLVYHTRTGKHRSGSWATVLEGDAGLPDLILCRPPRLLFVELKTKRRGVKPKQRVWLDALGACGAVEVYVWRERDWESGAVQHLLD